MTRPVEDARWITQSSGEVEWEAPTGYTMIVGEDDRPKDPGRPWWVAMVWGSYPFPQDADLGKSFATIVEAQAAALKWLAEVEAADQKMDEQLDLMLAQLEKEDQ